MTRKSRKNRTYTPEYEAVRQAQRGRNAHDREKGLCCSANHYGCQIRGKHTHGVNQPARSPGDHTEDGR